MWDRSPCGARGRDEDRDRRRGSSIGQRKQRLHAVHSAFGDCGACQAAVCVESVHLEAAC